MACNAAVRELSGTRYKVYRAFERRLKEKSPQYINFNDVAREIGCCEHTVSYHYEFLKNKKWIGVDNKMMFLLPRGRKKQK